MFLCAVAINTLEVGCHSLNDDLNRRSIRPYWSFKFLSQFMSLQNLFILLTFNTRMLGEEEAIQYNWILMRSSKS